MRPLSVMNFYINNRNRFLSIFTTIVLSTVLIYMVQMLIDSAFITSFNAFVEPQRHYSSITRKGALLDEKLLDEINNLDSVERVMPWVFRYTNFNIAIGGNEGTKIFTVKHNDMLTLMSKLGLSLKEGRLPEPGAREIAIHYRLAKNKNLKIGDKIGSNIDKEEVLPGEQTIVGLLDGKSIVSFDSLETWLNDNEVTFEYMLGMIILPKEGKELQLNRYLDLLFLPGLEVRTFDSINTQYTRDMENIKIILTFINILIIVIVSFCTGFLCYVYFSQRRSEFGLLNAIGYTKQQVINRAFLEIGGINILGFVVGVALSLFAGNIIDRVSYTPRGQILQVWNVDYLMRAACIPLFVIVLSIVPVWRMLKKLDPISIIERGQHI